VKAEDALQQSLAFLGRGLVEIHPDLGVLIHQHHLEEVQAQILADQFTLTEYERANHAVVFPV
jgi:hypothetical protein